MTWSSTTVNVDIETGETLTKHQTKQYIKVKTLKRITYDKAKTRGYIEYTNEYQRSKQLDLFADK